MPKLKTSPIERFHTKYEIDPISGCHNWTASLSEGYGMFWDHKHKHCRAHRWIYQYLNGPIPKGLVVRHKCHNRACVNPEHLELGTHQDNMDDMVKAGRAARGDTVAHKGEKNPHSVLTEQDVILIKKFFKRHNGHGVGTFLGRWFGISASNILSIKNQRAWQHL